MKIKRIIENIKDSEIYRPIRDYCVIEEDKSRKNKLVFKIGVIIIGWLIIAISRSEKIDVVKMYNEMIDVEINIISLLLSFSIAYFTMLITASGNNVERLKEYKSKYILNTDKISLFRELSIKLTYTIYLEVFALIGLIFTKLMLLNNVFWLQTALFLFTLIIITDILIEIINIIKNIYFSFSN